MGLKLKANNFAIPEADIPGTIMKVPYVILGDEAFALHTNLMKSYPRLQSLHDTTKAIYNYRHSRARRTTENAFGILNSQFRIFSTAIIAEPDTVDDFIMASLFMCPA